MGITKIRTLVDGVENKVIDFNDIASGLASGSHIIKVEAYNGATLIHSDTRNITIAASFEPETTAFMTHADVNIPNDGTIFYSGTVYETTGAALWTAIDNFIKREKTAARWTNILYFRPRIKGTALAHAKNLKDPATFVGTHFGSWVHDGGGSTANGTNTYMPTGFNPSIQQTAGANGMGAVLFSYNESGVNTVLGAYVSTTEAAVLYDSGGTYKYAQRYNGDLKTVATSAPGLFGVRIVNRISATAKQYLNGTEVFSADGTGTLPNKEIYEGALDISGSISASSYFNGRLGCTFQVANFSAADAVDFCASVATLENDLKRKNWT